MCLSALMVMLSALTLVVQPASANPPVKVEVDVQRVEGPFNTLSGAQGTPLAFVEQFKACRVARVRFPQDCAPNSMTLGGLFPDENADPRQVASYRFKRIDPHIEAARQAGCEILWQSSYDVGGSDSWKGINLGGRAPTDMRRWCTVVRRCLEHFNNGWARGFDYAVRYVEFVNEPTGLGGFVGARRKDLLPAFIAFLQMVEDYNRDHPQTPVTPVGPGIPLGMEDWSTFEPGYREMLKSLKKHKQALPVFSYHSYGKDSSPPAKVRLARAHRKLLDQAGFSRTKLWNTEWQGTTHVKDLLGVKRSLFKRSYSAEEIARSQTALATYAIASKLRYQGLLDGSFYYLATRRAWPRWRAMVIGERRMAAGRARYFATTRPPAQLAKHELVLARLADRTGLLCKTTVTPADGTATAAVCRSRSGDELAFILCNLSPSVQDFHLEGDLSALSGRPQATTWLLSAKGLERLKGLGGGTIEREGNRFAGKVSVPPLSTVVIGLEKNQ